MYYNFQKFKNLWDNSYSKYASTENVEVQKVGNEEDLGVIMCRSLNLREYML